MNTIKQALKSRTVLYGIAVAVLSILQGYVGFIPASPAHQLVLQQLASALLDTSRFNIGLYHAL